MENPKSSVSKLDAKHNDVDRQLGMTKRALDLLAKESPAGYYKLIMTCLNKVDRYLNSWREIEKL
jgi:hypothetical protein